MDIDDVIGVLEDSCTNCTAGPDSYCKECYQSQAIKYLNMLNDIVSIVESIEQDDCNGMCDMSKDEFIDEVCSIVHRVID